MEVDDYITKLEAEIDQLLVYQDDTHREIGVHIATSFQTDHGLIERLNEDLADIEFQLELLYEEMERLVNGKDNH